MWKSPSEAVKTFDRDYESFLQQYGTGEDDDERRKRRKSTIGGKLRFDVTDSEITTATSTIEFIRQPQPKYSRQDSFARTDSRNENKEETHTKALITARTECATLQSKANRLERELAETRVQLERQKMSNAKSTKEFEQRLSQIEVERKRAVDREESVGEELASVKEQWQNEVEKMREQMQIYEEDNAEMREQLAEDDHANNSTVIELRNEMLEEKQKRIQFENDSLQKTAQLEEVRKTNLDLVAQLTETNNRLWAAELKAQELENKVRSFEDENQLANTLRNDFRHLKQLKMDNELLKRRSEQYRLTSENTALLKEKNCSLESRYAVLFRENENLLKENNELKVVMAQASRGDGRSHCLVTVDTLAHDLTTNQNEHKILEQKFVNQKAELDNKEMEIGALHKEVSRLSDKMELMRNEAQSAISQLNEKCSDLDCALIDQQQEYQRKITDLQGNVDSAQESLRIAQEQATSSSSELERLKVEMAKKDELIDSFKERLHVKGDFDPKKTKVFHMEFNPLQEAHQEHRNRLEILETENEKLKIRLEELEKERLSHEAVDVTGIVNDRMVEEQLQREIEGLKQQIQKVEKEKQRSKEIQTELAKNYREMCTMLTGYQLKMKDQSHYLMQSMYEKEEGKHFMFEKRSDGELCLLHTDYAMEAWKDFLEMYLMTDNSIPAFLAAVTLQLYDREKESTMLSHDDTADVTVKEGISGQKL